MCICIILCSQNFPEKLLQRNYFLMRKRQGGAAVPKISRSGKTCPLSRTCLKGNLYLKSTCLRKITALNPAWVVRPSSFPCNLKLKWLEVLLNIKQKAPDFKSTLWEDSKICLFCQKFTVGEIKDFCPHIIMTTWVNLVSVSLLTENVSSENQRIEKASQNWVFRRQIQECIYTPKGHQQNLTSVSRKQTFKNNCHGHFKARALIL